MGFVLFTSTASCVVEVPGHLTEPADMLEWANNHGDPSPGLCHHCAREVTLGDFEADVVTTDDGLDFAVRDVEDERTRTPDSVSGPDGTSGREVAVRRAVLEPLRPHHQRVQRPDGSWRCTSCRDVTGAYADWPSRTDRLIYAEEEL